MKITQEEVQACRDALVDNRAALTAFAQENLTRMVHELSRRVGMIDGQARPGSNIGHIDVAEAILTQLRTALHEARRRQRLIAKRIDQQSNGVFQR